MACIGSELVPLPVPSPPRPPRSPRPPLGSVEVVVVPSEPVPLLSPGPSGSDRLVVPDPLPACWSPSSPPRDSRIAPATTAMSTTAAISHIRLDDDPPAGAGALGAGSPPGGDGTAPEGAG